MCQCRSLDILRQLNLPTALLLPSLNMMRAVVIKSLLFHQMQVGMLQMRCTGCFEIKRSSQVDHRPNVDRAASCKLKASSCFVLFICDASQDASEQLRFVRPSPVSLLHAKVFRFLGWAGAQHCLVAVALAVASFHRLLRCTWTASGVSTSRGGSAAASQQLQCQGAQGHKIFSTLTEVQRDFCNWGRRRTGVQKPSLLGS